MFSDKKLHPRQCILPSKAILQYHIAIMMFKRTFSSSYGIIEPFPVQFPHCVLRITSMFGSKPESQGFLWLCPYHRLPPYRVLSIISPPSPQPLLLFLVDSPKFNLIISLVSSLRSTRPRIYRTFVCSRGVVQATS